MTFGFVDRQTRVDRVLNFGLFHYTSLQLRFDDRFRSSLKPAAKMATQLGFRTLLWSDSMIPRYAAMGTLLAAIPFAFSGFALYCPRLALKCLQIPASNTPEEEHKLNTLLGSYRVRAMALAVIALTFANGSPVLLRLPTSHPLRYWLLGIMQIPYAIIRAEDGNVSSKLFGKGQWLH